MPERDSPRAAKAPLASERVRLRRKRERGSHARAVIDAILDEGLIAHLGIVDADGQPFVIPTLHARRGDVVYVHGSAAGRAMKTLATGVRACLTVSLLDGLVLARSAMHHSANYRSVMLLGTARLIECAREAVAQGLVSSAHDCADGGIAVALAECCIAGGRGARIAFALGRGERTDRVLFGEGIGRIVVSLSSEHLPALRRLAQRLAVPVQVLGAVGGSRLVIGPDNGPPDPWIDVEVDELAAAAQGQVQAPATPGARLRSPGRAGPATRQRSPWRRP